jgi:hypothetical protein
VLRYADSGKRGGHNNPVAKYIVDHTEQLARRAAAERLEVLARILRMAHLDASSVMIG